MDYNTVNWTQSDGTSALETFSVILPSFFHCFLTVLTVSIIGSHRFLLEFILLVVPVLLDMTAFSGNLHHVLLISILTSLSLALFIKNLFIQSDEQILKSRFNSTRKPPTSDSEKQTDINCNFLTNARATISLLSIIAILAVDFRVFPRRFAKTEKYGYSLMDVGVGLFVYANGIVGQKHTTFMKMIKNSLPLFVLGISRTVLVKKIDYHVSVLEYGVHWNFFFTLAFVKLFATIIGNIVPIRFIWINATVLVVLHEILLQKGLNYVVLEETNRDNFFLANKEGLVSLLGYTSIYLYSLYFEYLFEMRKKHQSKFKIIFKFVIVSFVLLYLSMKLENWYGISRRLANSSYCFWVLFIGIFMTGLYYFCEIIQTYYLPGTVLSPDIFQAINYNGLIYFLIANLLTGLINIVFDTMTMSMYSSLSILFLYNYITCWIVWRLYVQKIKMKL